MGRRSGGIPGRLHILHILILGVLSSSFVEASSRAAEKYESDSLNLISDIQTRIVLLAEASANVRSKRDTHEPFTNSGEDTTSAPREDNSQVYNSEGGQDLARGQPRDPLLEELEHNVDITENKINENLKNKLKTEGFGIGENETFRYYDQTFVKEENFHRYYQDLDHINETDDQYKGMVKEHDMLSQSYRRAATINLSFKFPFYGHEVENITIATGGFLYTGDYVHSWLAATQYIAPLMANFDTSNNQHAKIRYLDDGTKLVVEWKDVYLQDKEFQGPFTFQVTILQKGDIWFAYKKIPLEIVSMKDDDHPVKVGLSDAYIIDRKIYFARRKTIYEYHRLNMKNEEIKNLTAIVFRALDTCNMNKECTTCLAKSNLHCRWCPDLNRCSDGTDRNRQDWLKRKCDVHNISTIETCPRPGQVFNGFPGGDYEQLRIHQTTHQSNEMNVQREQIFKINPTDLNPGTIVVSVFSCLILFVLIGWIGYAYFNPNSASGRFLIKYRPGAWRWRQSGGRYTAASIHM